MSFKTCLFVTALLLPACIDPAKQGMSTATGETGSSSSTTTSTTGPTTGNTVTTDDSNTSIVSTDPGGSCDDGKQNQDESDIDCGGKCSPCDGDAMCGGDGDCKSGKCDGNACFPLLRSCLELIMERPDLVSDSYPLDPDGDGANPLEFFCDMEQPDPGWTQVFVDSLDPAPIMGVWDPVVAGDCADSGYILGPYGMGSSLTLSIDGQKVPHTQLRVVADLLIMDSWDAFDNDLIMIKLGGTDIFSQSCDSLSDFTCGQAANLCGDMAFNDAVLPVSTAPAMHDGDDITLEFTSNLNEPVANESFGIDKAVVFVK